MNLSPDQQHAVNEFMDWHYSGNPHGIFKLMGCGGTGKTSIAIRMAELAGKDTAILCAFSGKAASRLKFKTGMPTMTLHRLLKHPIEDDEDKPRFADKIWRDIEFARQNGDLTGGEEGAYLDNPSLIIVDEASMCDYEFAKQLLTFQDHSGRPVPILALGDDFQLPPINKQQKFTLLDTRAAGPKCTLTTIHRQDEGAILDIANRIRYEPEQKSLLGLADNKTAFVTDKPYSQLLKGKILEDFVKKDPKFLCRTNAMVAEINERVRNVKGFTDPHFQVGDKVMVLNNNYDLDVFNGEEFVILQKEESVVAQALAREEFPRMMDHLPSAVLMKSVDTGEFRSIPVALPVLTSVDFKVSSRCKGVYLQRSYASTVHKYQGSESDTVMVINEPNNGDSAEINRRWLYTACTRARKELYVVGSRIY